MDPILLSSSLKIMHDFFTSLLWRKFLKNRYPEVYDTFVQIYGENLPVLLNPNQYPLPEEFHIESLRDTSPGDIVYVFGRDLIQRGYSSTLPSEVLENLDRIYRVRVDHNQFFPFKYLITDEGYKITISRTNPTWIPVVVAD